MKTQSAKIPPASKKTQDQQLAALKPAADTGLWEALSAGLLNEGDNKAAALQNRLHDDRFQRAQRQGLAAQIGQVQGNQQVLQLVSSQVAGEKEKAVLRQEDEAEEVDENAPSPEAPGLTVGIANQINDLIRERRRRDALNVLVEHLGSTGQINLDLLTDRRMHYDPGLAGEGVAAPPGFRRDPDTNEWVARPTPVRIGPDAFRQGVPWLYSSVMHEYQHVLQFQENVARGTMGQRNLGWLIERQEVEAYATEIINSEQTGISQNPRQMRETWRRLHAEHWMKLGRRSRELLNDLYTQAHDIAQAAVGEGVRLPFRPAR
jgi:hypothetical protein